MTVKIAILQVTGGSEPRVGIEYFQGAMPNHHPTTPMTSTRVPRSDA